MCKRLSHVTIIRPRLFDSSALCVSAAICWDTISLMPTPEALIAFTLATIVFVVVPGPSVLFVIGRSLSYGSRGGFLSVLGNGLGSLPLAVLVAFGVGSIVAKSVVLFTIIKLLGAAYLIYLGVQAIRHRNDSTAEDAASAGRAPLTPATMLRQGFIVGVTNPMFFRTWTRGSLPRGKAPCWQQPTVCQ